MGSSSVLRSKPLRSLSVEERRNLLEKIAGKRLQAIEAGGLDERRSAANIENFVGSVQVPLGIAGPVHVKGRFAAGEYVLPLATTEGALVASVSRGCKAAGLVTTDIIKDAQTRAPLFSAKTHEEAEVLARYMRTHFGDIKAEAEKTSRHLVLCRANPVVRDNLVWLRMEAETGEAMGMNMITIAADAVGRFVAKRTGAVFESVSGNLCADKKAARVNVEEGRGKSVTATALVPRETVAEVLKTTPERIVRLNAIKNQRGSEVAGALGRNAHHANIVAALYLATGQDAAHVVEGSLGTTDANMEGDMLRFSIRMPCVQTGVIGGGTTLPGQGDCLAMLGMVQDGRPERNGAKILAEVVAAAVLAGELSLLAAEAEHQLAAAHRRLNR